MSERRVQGSQRIAMAMAVGLGIALAIGAGAVGVSAHARITPASAGVTGAHYPPGTTLRLHQRTVQVTILNFKFMPARLVVSPGTRIVWTNKDSSDPHTVAATKGDWSSEALDTGNQFARVFKKTGTITYYCTIHPFMHGTIIVAK